PPLKDCYICMTYTNSPFVFATRHFLPFDYHPPVGNSLENRGYTETETGNRTCSRKKRFIRLPFLPPKGMPMPRRIVWTFASFTAILTPLFTGARLEAQAQHTPPVVATTPGQATTCQPAPCPGATAQAPEPTSPLQIKIGDATITPVGFMDLTNTWRSTNAGT